MADTAGSPLSDPSTLSSSAMPLFQPPATVDEARAKARERFRTRFQAGEAVGGCQCHDADEPLAAAPRDGQEPAAQVAGVRFRDSGRTFFFEAAETTLEVGDWVVVETERGREACRVVIAPHQVRLNLLQGDLTPILRKMDHGDIQRLDALKGSAADAVKTFGSAIRRRGLPLKTISAEYGFDGSTVVLNYSAGERDRPDLRDLTREMADILRCRVELRQVGPRDEARLLGGLGRCGRTLCCSSWLPVYPEISMNLAKTQDLPLNPSKVSGVCGRLLCCLSYENEQYKQMKAVMPRLGQQIETPGGSGMVISMQVLKELVTVRLDEDQATVTFPAADLGLGSGQARTSDAAAPRPTGAAASDEPPATGETVGASSHTGGDADLGDAGRRRRRRSRGPRRDDAPFGS